MERRFRPSSSRRTSSKLRFHPRRSPRPALISSRSRARENRCRNRSVPISSSASDNREASSASAATKSFALDRTQGILEPGGRQVVLHHLLDRLENLEVAPLSVLGPECHHGLQWRAAGDSTGKLGREHRSVLRQRKAHACPFLHAFNGLEMFRGLLEGA